MHKNSLLVFKERVMPLIRPEHRVLEIGPNGFPSDYRKCFSSPMQWDTLDIYPSDLLTYPNTPEYEFPIPDGQYDVVLAGQVMEHVRKIWVWIRELERVCKEGGLVITISPVSWPFHEAPVDCWRIYPDGMKALLDDTSLKIEHCEFESLECPQYARHTPGKSLEAVDPKLRAFYKLAGPFGFPVERSYDLVAVSRKTSQAAGNK
jgi:SAM-dependent methyltransferase